MGYPRLRYIWTQWTYSLDDSGSGGCHKEALWSTGVMELAASTETTTHTCVLAQKRPPPSPPPPRVNVTVYVEGVVTVYVSHGYATNATKDVDSEDPPDLTYYLVDNSDTTVSVRVDFGAAANALSTGMVVQTGLNLQVSATKAAELQLLGLGSVTGRRLLSKDEEAARSMVSEYHGTRRSLQEVSKLVDLLRSLNVIYLDQVPNSEEVIVLKKNANKDLWVVDGKPQKLTSLTFVFSSSACGIKPAFNAERVRKHWFDNGDNAEIPGSLQRYFGVCSYNQITFAPEDNIIFDVDVPCTGTTTMGRYDLKNGKGNGKDAGGEVSGLVALAKDYLQRTNITLFNNYNSFKRKILVFPFGSMVPWLGLALLGCAPDQADCYTWLNSRMTSNTFNLGVVVQELNHNIGLAHSSMAVSCDPYRCSYNEYADFSCPMGWGQPTDTKSLVCMTSPQSYKAGWASPIAGGHLSVFTDFQPGVSRQFTLPAMALTKKNFVRIVTDTANTIVDDSTTQTQRALFLSYRVIQNGTATYDSGLWPQFDRHVGVHEYNSTANGVTAKIDQPPTRLAALDLSEDYVRQLVPPFGNLRIRFLNRTSQNATVAVCRFLVANESAAGGSASCQDGLDNDCDGLVDMADPDCNPTLKKPPLPPPQRATPSSPSGWLPAFPDAPPTRQRASPPPRPPPSPRRSPPPPPYRPPNLRTAVRSKAPPSPPRAPRAPRGPRAPSAP